MLAGRLEPDADQDSGAIVAHVTAQPAVSGKPPDRRTKTDALDETADPDGLSLHRKKRREKNPYSV
jgi:hypothetical protein